MLTRDMREHNGGQEVGKHVHPEIMRQWRPGLVSRNTAASNYLLCWSFSGFEYRKCFVSDVLCIQSIHWHSRFQEMTDNTVCRVALLIFFLKKPSGRKHYIFTGYSIEDSPKQCWKMSMPCGPTYTAISRIASRLSCTVFGG